MRSEAGTTASRFISRLLKRSHPDSNCFWPAGLSTVAISPSLSQYLSLIALLCLQGVSYLTVALGEGFFLSLHLKRIMNHWEKALMLIRLFFSPFGGNQMTEIQI